MPFPGEKASKILKEREIICPVKRIVIPSLKNKP